MENERGGHRGNPGIEILSPEASIWRDHLRDLGVIDHRAIAFTDPTLEHLDALIRAVEAGVRRRTPS